MQSGSVYYAVRVSLLCSQGQSIMQSRSIMQSGSVYYVVRISLLCSQCRSTTQSGTVYYAVRVSLLCSQGQSTMQSGSVHYAVRVSLLCSQGQYTMQSGSVHYAVRVSLLCSQGQSIMQSGSVHYAVRVSLLCSQGQSTMQSGSVYYAVRVSTLCSQGQYTMQSGSVHYAVRSVYYAVRVSTLCSQGQSTTQSGSVHYVVRVSLLCSQGTYAMHNIMSIQVFTVCLLCIKSVWHTIKVPPICRKLVGWLAAELFPRRSTPTRVQLSTPLPPLHPLPVAWPIFCFHLCTLRGVFRLKKIPASKRWRSEWSNLYQYKLNSFATATDHALQGPVGVKAGIVLWNKEPLASLAWRTPREFGTKNPSRVCCVHSGLDRILSSFFIMASRRAHYTLHQVLKHILEGG